MKKNKGIFLIVNQGLHPIIPKLKRIYGEEINVKILSRGNLPILESFNEKFTKEVCDEIKKYEYASKIYVVWSGIPHYNLLVFNSIKEILRKDPICLIYNKDYKDGQYEEFDFNIKKLLS